MKKQFISFVSIVLCITMIISPLFIAATGVSDSIRYGDVNDDGAIDTADVELLAKYISNDTTVTINLAAADVDRNSVVDLNDLLYLVKVVKGADITLGDNVTITFQTNGGEDIQPITIVTGGTITAPTPEKNNAVFLGWFTDSEFKNPFYPSDPILEDITIYSKYQEIENATEYMPSAYALRDQAPDVSFEVERVSGDVLPEIAVVVLSIDGSTVPKIEFISNGENKWTVKAVDGYTEGASYTITLAEGFNFAGKDKSIREASFYIKKEEIANFTLNDDIIYIKDTAAMTYTLSNGTTCEVLDSAVLYNEDDVITGSFAYTKSESLAVDDTICIYKETDPNKRDYINGDYSEDPAAYIVITSINSTTITFRGMTMTGGNTDVEELISLPSTIPFSVLNLPEGNGTVDFSDRDVAAIYGMYGTNAPEEAKEGDFLVFYVGNFGSLSETDTVMYKKVTAVNGTTLTYVSSSKDELLNAVNLFLNEGVDGDKMLENVDKNALEKQVMSQVEKSNFAEEAVQYLAGVALASDEYEEYAGEHGMVVYDENGLELTEEQLKAYGLGKSFSLGDDVELGFNITKCDGENSHFEDGLKVTLQISAEFEVDVGKGGKMGSLKIELSAAFTQELFIDVDINAKADITWVLFIPIINDIVFSSAVDVMSYTGISLEAKFYTQEPSEDFIDKLEKEWGVNLGKDTMDKIKNFKEKYEKQLGDGSLGEDIEGFWETQTQLVEDIVKSGELTEEEAKSCLESTSELNVVKNFCNNIGAMDDEEYNAGVVDLAERYADMIGEEDNGWLELCKIQLFECPIKLYIFEINITGHFVIRANINIALGANLEYEIGKRYVNWFSIFGKGSGSSEMDLVEERFAFQFYAMGYIGLRVGILLEVEAGIISTKIGSVGINAEFGAYAELWGYFHYLYTKYRPLNGMHWEETESVTGALYFEFGLYLEINLKASLFSILEKEWNLYSGQWALLSAGAKQNIYGFATELEADEVMVVEDEDGNSSNGITRDLPENYRSMKSLDMKTGEQDTPVKPWISYYGYNFWDGDTFSLTQREDKTNFTYSLSSEYFELVPIKETKDNKEYIVDYEIKVNVPEGVHYLECDLRIVWCLDKLCYSKYDIDLTIPLIWTDLSDQELKEYKTATVKVGNETEGYRTVWSERFIKGQEFDLPDEKTVLSLAGYSGENDVKYSGYTGYTTSDRGEITSTEKVSLYFDTVYYFDMNTKEYTITIEGVQNANGTVGNRQFTAKYGKEFDFSSLLNTGTNVKDIYTVYTGIKAFGNDGKETQRKADEIIAGNFASELIKGDVTYKAQYRNNSGTVTYKFSGIALAPINKVYKNGEMPSQNDFLSAIKAVDSTAYITSITPAFIATQGDITYEVNVAIPPKPLQKYTITYRSGGASIGSALFEERSAVSPPSVPTKTGYTFGGWFYDEALSSPMDWTRNMPSMNFTLYANWSANSYTISFNAGEGTATSTSIGVTYDKAVGTLPNATRANYTFLGWYTAASGGTSYTTNTTYKVNSNITLYAHWQRKDTITNSSITFSNNAAVAYDGNTHKPTLNCSVSGVNATSFTVQYKRQILDREWTTTVPKNAGTYDVRVIRQEDDKYLAFYYTYTGVQTISKISRSISAERLGAEAYYSNILVNSIPNYDGDGSPMYSVERWNGSSWQIERNWQLSAGFMNLSSGKYRVKFYVAEGENYLQSNSVTLGTEYSISSTGNSDFKSMSYRLDTHTSGAGLSDTTGKVHARFRYINGGEGGSVQISNTRWLAQWGEDWLPSPVDPWMILGLRYDINSSNGWQTDSNKTIIPYVNGAQQFGYVFHNSSFWLDGDGDSKSFDFENQFKRKITNVGDFNSPVNLVLGGNNGVYSYTYDGKVVDNYASWATNGTYYNCYAHTYAPTISFECETPVVYGHNYSQYFRSGIRTLTVDRDNLYKAMVRDGLTSFTATATLTFDSASTSSGNVWKKNLTFTVPAAAAVSESFGSYSSGSEDVNIQTSEDEDYVYVNIGLEQNPGVWGVKNEVTYNTEKLELAHISEGNLASVYEINTTNISGQYTILAYCDDVRASYQSGNFVTLTFKKLTDDVDLANDLSAQAVQGINSRGEDINITGIIGIGDFTAVPPTDDAVYLTTEAAISDEIYAQLNSRNTEVFTMHYSTDTLITAEKISEWFHTAKERLGVYDSFEIKKYTATASKYTKNDTYYYTLTYQVSYYTTPEQEAAFETKLTEAVNGLNLTDSDYEKLLTIYDYVCSAVSYEVGNDLCFTAYGALNNGKAVCQGYALLLMRMLQEAGFEADVVFGEANDISHMWNVIKFDGKYYLMDITWDDTDTNTEYVWLLKGTNTFTDHTPAEAYAYAICQNDYFQKVTFHANGGTGTMESQKVVHGENENLAESTFAKEAYTLTGWNTKEDGSGTAYANEATVNFTADTTLYAKWIRNTPTYIMTIPAEIQVDGNNKLVEIKNIEDLLSGESIDISVSAGLGSDGRVTLANTEDSILTLKSQMVIDGESATTATPKVASFTSSGSMPIAFRKPDEEPAYAGTYTATITFNIQWIR